MADWRRRRKPEERAFILPTDDKKHSYDSGNAFGTQQMTRYISWLRGSRSRWCSVALAARISISAAARTVLPIVLDARELAGFETISALRFVRLHRDTMKRQYAALALGRASSGLSAVFPAPSRSDYLPV